MNYTCPECGAIRSHKEMCKCLEIKNDKIVKKKPQEPKKKAKRQVTGNIKDNGFVIATTFNDLFKRMVG